LSLIFCNIIKALITIYVIFKKSLQKQSSPFKVSITLSGLPLVIVSILYYLQIFNNLKCNEFARCNKIVYSKYVLVYLFAAGVLVSVDDLVLLSFDAAVVFSVLFSVVGCVVASVVGSIVFGIGFITTA